MMPHDLEKDPLFLLYDVARLMRTRADQRARLNGMTRAQWVILAWLELEPGLSQNELANLVEVEPITVGRLIDRLAGRGLVERRADPKDRRIRRLHLTDAAAPILTDIHRYRAELSGSIVSAVGSERLDQVTASLFDLKTALLQEAQNAAAGKAAS